MNFIVASGVDYKSVGRSLCNLGLSHLYHIYYVRYNKLNTIVKQQFKIIKKRNVILFTKFKS